MAELSVRGFKPADATACAALLFDVVREGTTRFYSEQQRAAWAPAPMSAQEFLDRLDGQSTWVAEDEIGIAGFFSLRPPDTLDLAYVRRDCMGVGVASALCDVLEDHARALGVAELTSDASELAHRFFARRGWRVLARQEFERHGVLIHNYKMSLAL